MHIEVISRGKASFKGHKEDIFNDEIYRNYIWKQIKEINMTFYGVLK